MNRYFIWLHVSFDLHGVDESLPRGVYICICRDTPSWAPRGHHLNATAWQLCLDVQCSCVALVFSPTSTFLLWISIYPHSDLHLPCRRLSRAPLVAGNKLSTWSDPSSALPCCKTNVKCRQFLKNASNAPTLECYHHCTATPLAMLPPEMDSLRCRRSIGSNYLFALF